jgi:hypothetical protein
MSNEWGDSRSMLSISSQVAQALPVKAPYDERLAEAAQPLNEGRLFGGPRGIARPNKAPRSHVPWTTVMTGTALTKLTQHWPTASFSGLLIALSRDSW